MIGGAGVERVVERLWAAPPGGAVPDVYALLDAARDERIHPWIRRRALDYTCLFAGPLAPELAAAAPYLVHLYRSERFSRELVELAWGRSWGTFVVASASMEELRVHFRGFLRVRDERGKRFLFRYYDPRVLRAYLPTCDARELGTVFGPVWRLCAEDESGGALLEYTQRDGALETRRVPLPPHAPGGDPAAGRGNGS